MSHFNKEVSVFEKNIQNDDQEKGVNKKKHGGHLLSKKNKQDKLTQSNTVSGIKRKIYELK